MRQIKNLITLLTVFLVMGLSQSAVAQDSKEEFSNMLKAFKQSIPFGNESEFKNFVNELLAMENSIEIKEKKFIVISELRKANYSGSKEEMASLLLKSLCKEGDSIIFSEDWRRFKAGTKLKKKNGVLTMCVVDRDGNVGRFFTMNDGSVFRGDLLGTTEEWVPMFLRGYNDYYEWGRYLIYDELKPFSGEIKYANGTEDVFFSGVSNAEKEKAEQAKYEANRKAYQKAKQADHAQLVKKYGKKFADDVENGRITLGMPEALLVERFRAHLTSESYSSKVYKIHDVIHNRTCMIVKVSNGKVTRIQRLY